MYYNEYDLRTYGFIANRSKGINITPETEFDIFKTSNGEEKRTGARRKRRIISVSGGIKSTDIRKSCEDLSVILDSTDLIDKKIIFDNDTKYYMGYCSSNNLGKEWNTLTEDVELVFNCESLRYGDTVTEENIDGVELTNAGTAPCFGVISFTLTGETTLNITLAGTTGKIAILAAPAGAYTVDLNKRKLYKDGVLANYLDFDTTKFETFIISPGNYTINFDVVIDADYTYSEMYL